MKIVRDMEEFDRDAKKALALVFSFDKVRRAQGIELLIDLGRRVMRISYLFMSGGIFAGCSLVAAIPPYDWSGFWLMFSSLVLFILSGILWRYLRKSDRSFLWGWILLFFGIMPISHFSKELEESRYEALTPEEKFARNQRIDEEARKELDALRAEQEAEDAAKKERVRARDIQQENRRQREYYETLGAPKILYRCKGRDMESAIGAGFGSINRLIDEAQSRCGLAGFEVIKREDGR